MSKQALHSLTLEELYNFRLWSLVHVLLRVLEGGVNLLVVHVPLLVVVALRFRGLCCGLAHG
jgi:hypothetical protein